MADDLGTIYGIVMGLMLFGVIISVGVTTITYIVNSDSEIYGDVNTSYLNTFSSSDYTKYSDEVSSETDRTTNSLMNVTPSTSSVDSVKISTWGAIKATLASPLYIKEAINDVNDQNLVVIPQEILVWVTVAFLLLIAMILVAVLWYR